MSRELTNLLPPERRTTLAREYLFRLGTFVLFALGFFTVVHGIMLAPPYAYVREELQAQEERLTDLTKMRADSGFTDLTSRVAAFAERATSLEELRAIPSASESVRAILEIPRSGVTLAGFTFSAPQGDQPGSMMVSGIAARRDSLQAFNRALGQLSFVRSTNLPVSAYAKESDIPFQISLTLSFETL